MIPVGSQPDVLDLADAFALCKAHADLDLETDAIGALVVGEPYETADLRAEMEAIGSPAAQRVLTALTYKSLKYREDQERAPAGSSTGGQWTSGGQDASGNSANTTNYVHNEWAKTARALDKPHQERVAKAIGMPRDEMIAKVEASMKAEMDRAGIWIRVPSRAVGNILDVGYKPVAETGHTGAGSTKHEPGEDGRKRSIGEYDDIRREAEFGMFGHPMDQAAGRPVYGYSSWQKDGGLAKDDGYDQYGDTAVRLKDDLKERSTITYGDSLDTGKTSLIPRERSYTDYRGRTTTSRDMGSYEWKPDPKGEEERPKEHIDGRPVQSEWSEERHEFVEPKPLPGETLFPPPTPGSSHYYGRAYRNEDMERGTYELRPEYPAHVDMQPRLVPSPMLNPKAESMLWDMYEDHPGFAVGKEEAKPYGPSHWTDKEKRDWMDGHFKPEDSGAEVQVHGGVKPTDIAEIKFSDTPRPGALKRLEKLGIKYSVDEVAAKRFETERIKDTIDKLEDDSFKKVAGFGRWSSSANADWRKWQVKQAEQVSTVAAQLQIDKHVDAAKWLNETERTSLKGELHRNTRTWALDDALKMTNQALGITNEERQKLQGWQKDYEEWTASRKKT